MARPRNPLPHKSSGSARAVWTDAAGVRHFRLLPGPFGSPESKSAFAALLLELQAAPCRPQAAGVGLTLAELLLAYLDFAERHYRDPDGRPTSEIYVVKIVVRALRKLHGAEPASAFGPLALKAARQGWVNEGRSRTECNRRAGMVKRIFKWAVSEELVPASAHQGLAAVAGLQPGRTAARETEPVGPVEDDAVDATLPFLGRHVRGLVEFQRLTGKQIGPSIPPGFGLMPPVPPRSELQKEALQICEELAAADFSEVPGMREIMIHRFTYDLPDPGSHIPRSRLGAIVEMAKQCLIEIVPDPPDFVYRDDDWYPDVGYLIRSTKELWRRHHEDLPILAWTVADVSEPETPSQPASSAVTPQKGFAEGAVTAEESKPCWDPRSGELSFKGEVVAIIKGQAATQRVILDEFQAKKWNSPIEVTRAIRDGSKDWGKTLSRLNDLVEDGVIRFGRDGSKIRMTWYLAKP